MKLQHSLPEWLRNEFSQHLKTLKEALIREDFTDTQKSMKNLIKFSLDYQLGDSNKYNNFTLSEYK